MKIFLLTLLLHFCFTTNAQTRLNFSYDAAGNQENRTLCTTCSGKSIQEVQETEALIENDLKTPDPEDVFSYYPNPVKEELYLQWQLTQDNYVTSVNLYSITGKQLQIHHPDYHTTKLTLSFQQYPTGIYLILLSYKDGEEKSIKIIKQ